MKKLIFAIFCFAGILTFTSGQANAQGFSINAGANFAHFNDVNGAADSYTGLLAGIRYGFEIPNSPVVLRPGAFYSQKGAVFKDGNIESITKLEYLEIPVAAKFNFILDNPSLVPHVYFGPYLGLLLGAEKEVTDGDTSISSDISSDIKNTDLGVVVGAGVDINKFNAGLRYSAGLTEIDKNNVVDGKTGALSIVVGVKF